MYSPLVIVLGVITLGGVVWYVAVTQAHITIIGFIQPEKLTEAGQSIDTIKPPWWGIFIVLAVYVYLSFLSILRNLLRKQEPPNPQDGEEHN